MTASLRITIDFVRQRMEQGENFVITDTLNVQEWTKSDGKLPEAIRAPADSIDKILANVPNDKPILTYCT